jgi:hypothetical protein
MPSTITRFWVATLATAAGAVLTLTAPAYADSNPPISVAAAYDTEQCDPAGPSARDGQLVPVLNAQLTGSLDNAMTAYRVSCARMVVKAVRDRGLSERAAVIAITTTIVESTLQNISEQADHDSLGLFQQRGTGWGTPAQRLDPIHATNSFLNAMLSKYPDGSWQSAPIGDVCQKVQVSGHPERYQPEAADAQRIVTAVWPYASGDNAGHGPLWGRNLSAANAWDDHATVVDENRNLTATASAATADGRLHVVTVLPGSGIWYRGRTGTTWDASARKIDDNGTVGSVALAARPDGTLDVFAVVPGSGIWQRTRPAGGDWNASAVKVDANKNITAVAATGLSDGSLRYAGLVAGSGIWTRAWTSAGGWEQNAVKVDDNREISAIAMTATPDRGVHLVGVVPGSGI